MGLLDRFKKGSKEEEIAKAPQKGKADAVAAKKEEQKSGAKPKTKAKAKTKTTASKGDTKGAYKVLIKPLITEKGTATGTYLFAVNPKTNKQEIKKAIKAVYGVTPLKVNVMNVDGKSVRWGKTTGKTKAWKKAVIYLKKGETIQTFEGI